MHCADCPVLFTFSFSLDNMKDLKGKKGANLIVKILAMVLMPMLSSYFLRCWH